MSTFDLFQYQGQQVRTVLVDGEPWFVLTDVCAVLDLTNPTVVAGRVDPDALSTAEVIDSMGRSQTARTVSEPGLYEVIFLSRKQEARAFKKWVLTEVLPAIRRTGQFGSVLPTNLADALELAAIEIRAKEAAESRLIAQAPKVEAYDALMDADGYYSVEQTAKLIGVGRNTLFRLMREDGVIVHGGRTPTQRHAHRFKVVASTYATPDGDEHTSYVTKVRPESIEWLARRYGSLASEERVS